MARLEAIARMLGTTAFRLAAITMAAFLTLALAIATVLVWQTNRIITDQVARELKAEIAVLRSTAQSGGVKSLEEAVALRSLPPARGLYRLTARDGSRLAGNLPAEPEELVGRGGGVFRYRPAQTGGAGDGERLAAAAVEEMAEARLIVARDVEEQRRFAERIRRSFLVGFGLLSLAALAGGFFAARRMLARIDAIAVTSRTIMAGDMTRRMPLAGDEFDELSMSLNAMLDRIELLMASLKEVSDNIAHDLKTPLNRLRNKAEAALREPGGEAVCREGLERVIEEADALIGTFNALLLIARLESGAVDETATLFDLSQIVADVVELYEPVAEEAGMTLVLKPSSPVGVHANRQLIGQAAANLIDNAIKYARTGNREAAGRSDLIEVQVSRRGADALLEVSDRGPGIGAKDRERVLERFVRLEESRTRPGTGLGLSLVAAVARLHRGRVKLDDNHPGLRATLSLPAAGGA